MTFAEERDKAFIDAVVNDKWNKVRKYSKKYGVPIPKKRNVMKAGVYKAVQYCTNIPEDVKTMAIQKCLQLGFSPFIKPYDPQESEIHCNCTDAEIAKSFIEDVGAVKDSLPRAESEEQTE